MKNQAITALTLSLSCLSGTAQAAPETADWTALNKAVINQHIIPGYSALATKSQQLQQQVKQLCLAPNQQQLESSKQAYTATLAAWQSIQHIQFGPIENLMRNFSMQFWPDKKNLTSKQLNKLLKAEDPAAVDPAKMRSASIAVKGLPALERLLFANDALTQYQQQPYRCQLTISIADHVAAMGSETNQEWQQYQLEFTQLDGNGFYEETTEASTELMKSLVEPIEIIRDLKILRPLGKSHAKAKPRRAESWRSEHSLQNIQLNLTSLHQLYNIGEKHSVKALLSAQGQTQLANEIDQAFLLIIQKLEHIKHPMAVAIEDPASYQQLAEISLELKALHFALSTAMQPLDITLGFNSRDGD